MGHRLFHTPVFGVLVLGRCQLHRGRRRAVEFHVFVLKRLLMTVDCSSELHHLRPPIEAEEKGSVNAMSRASEYHASLFVSDAPSDGHKRPKFFKKQLMEAVIFIRCTCGKHVSDVLLRFGNSEASGITK